MKSKLFLLTSIMFSLLILNISNIIAAEVLSDGWEELIDPGPISFSASGEVLNVSAGDTAADVWGVWRKSFDGAVGAVATINVSSTNGASNSFLGLRKYIGQVASGNYIVAEISVRDYYTDKHIWYRVRERNQNHVNIRTIGIGYLGDFSDYWDTGEDVAIGLAYIGGNIVFYTSKIDAFAIVRLSEPIFMSSRSFLIEVQAFATASSNPVIMGSVSNVTILYSNALGVFQGMGVADCDINQDGKTGLEEAIHALHVVAGVRGETCNSNTDCLATEYCEKQEGDCNSNGQCRPRPDACYDLWDPVCGCDNNTYGNACEAARAGVSISHAGQCRLTCSTNSDCPQGTYCSKPDGDCAGTGVCEEMPLVCPDIWDPVCGCDDKTYGNACEAAAAGVAVVSSGECRDSQCDDGTMVLCLMIPPVCGSHEILAIQNNCWVCVNEQTCRPWGEPGCSSDADCPEGQSCDPCGTSSCPVCDDCVPACVPDTP